MNTTKIADRMWQMFSDAPDGTMTLLDFSGNLFTAVEKALSSKSVGNRYPSLAALSGRFTPIVDACSSTYAFLGCFKIIKHHTSSGKGAGKKKGTVAWVFHDCIGKPLCYLNNLSKPIKWLHKKHVIDLTKLPKGKTVAKIAFSRVFLFGVLGYSTISDSKDFYCAVKKGKSKEARNHMFDVCLTVVTVATILTPCGVAVDLLVSTGYVYQWLRDTPAKSKK